MNKLETWPFMISLLSLIMFQSCNSKERSRITSGHFLVKSERNWTGNSKNSKIKTGGKKPKKTGQSVRDSALLFYFVPDLTKLTVLMIMRLTHTQAAQCFGVGQQNGALLSHLQLSAFSFLHSSRLIPPLGGQRPEVTSS